jgi:NitT/TauT family transport system substrate-binding protein
VKTVPLPLRLMPTRHSPFYSPFLATHAAGFLEREGIASSLRIPAEGESTGAALQRGEVDVIQSAVSSAWTAREKGALDIPIHIAQINQCDGFVLLGRKPDPNFTWSKLEGSTIITDHGHQPLVMLRWAAHNKGADLSRAHLLNLGTPSAMEAAFRAGQGDYIHLQCGVPQEMEREGAGSIIAFAGAGLPPLAFSSIAAPRRFVESDRIRPFLRAFAKAKAWARESPAHEISQILAPLFPARDPEALTAAIAGCQALGCWKGDVATPRDHYHEAQRAFRWAGGIKHEHAYEEVCLSEPATLRLQ